MALLAPVVTFWVPGIATPLATAAAAWVFVARVALARWENNQVRLGATAQEQFDCHVFGLPWHEALAGRPLATEDVLAAARRVKPTKREELRNWYSPKADIAPWPLNAVLCQSASATWSRRAHEHYARVLLGAAITWFTVGILMGLAAHVTLAGYLVELFLPSQPAFLDALELARRHSAASSRKSQLEVLTDELWARGTATGNGVTIDDCRTVQDHSYRHRRDSPQVSELFYRRYKRQDEDAMHRATAQKVAALKPASPSAD